MSCPLLGQSSSSLRESWQIAIQHIDTLIRENKSRSRIMKARIYSFFMCPPAVIWSLKRKDIRLSKQGDNTMTWWRQSLTNDCRSESRVEMISYSLNHPDTNLRSHSNVHVKEKSWLLMNKATHIRSRVDLQFISIIYGLYRRAWSFTSPGCWVWCISSCRKRLRFCRRLRTHQCSLHDPPRSTLNGLHSDRRWTTSKLLYILRNIKHYLRVNMQIQANQFQQKLLKLSRDAIASTNLHPSIHLLPISTNQ